MIKVAFYLENKNLISTDFSSPEKGNPGTGAAEYLHVAIPYFLNKYYGGSVEVVILANFVENLPVCVKNYQATSVNAAAKVAKEISCDLFVFRPRQKEESGILDLLDELRLPAIGRAALTPYPEHVRKMSRSRYFKALVCVGREQYDFLQDTPLYKKLVCINNGINVNSFSSNEKIEKDNNLVIYLGALVPQKGFHVLARAWPQVVKAIPNAKLEVIGSARVYNENASLGPWGVASEEYEREFLLPALSLEDGSLHPSVNFRGKMGSEKNDLIRSALVGVANPTGQTETCCVSAVEIQACSTAVVSGAFYALLDTVKHNKTGLLGRSEAVLANNIITLLQNPGIAIEMGEKGHEFVNNDYDFEVVTKKWTALFYNVVREKKLVYQFPRGHIFRHVKLLRIVNRPIQVLLGNIFFWPSVYEIENTLRYYLSKMRNALKSYK